jgi:Glycosyl transferases group 1
MRILELHAPYFQDLWRREHDVLAWGSDPACALRADAPVSYLDDVLRQAPPGWTPDVILFGDDSRVLRVLGLEDAPCPLVMLSVDAHHHSAWHAPLGSAFDVVFVAQRDYLPTYSAAGVPAPRWLPLWAPDGLAAPVAEKRHAVAFVGSIDPRFHPQRVRLLHALAGQLPLHVAEGAWAPVYAESRIVLNQTVKGDLNFRVFEAMGAGAMLLTEHTGNGLLELFADGEDLVTYPRGDLPALVERARYYLAHEDERAAIAARGRARILASHEEHHRAAEVLEAMRGLDTISRPPDVRRAGLARAYCALALQAERNLDRAPDVYDAYRTLCLSAATLLAIAPEMPEPDCRAVLGLVALQRGELRDAIDHLGSAVAKGGRTEDHVAFIESLILADDIGRAREAAEALRAEHPTYEFIAFLIARLDVLASMAAAPAAASGATP